jgi:hypothetical protein
MFQLHPSFSMFQLHLACAFFSVLTNFQLAEYNHGVLLKMKTKVQLPVVGPVQLAMAGSLERMSIARSVRIRCLTMLPFWNLLFLIELTNRYSSSSLCS